MFGFEWEIRTRKIRPSNVRLSFELGPDWRETLASPVSEDVQLSIFPWRTIQYDSNVPMDEV